MEHLKETKDQALNRRVLVGRTAPRIIHEAGRQRNLIHPAGVPRQPQVCILIPFLGRPEVTRACLRHYARLAQQQEWLDVRVLAVGSEGCSSGELAAECGVDYVEFPRSAWPADYPLPDGFPEPLVAKFQYAFQQAQRHYDPDLLWLTGCDDLITEGFLTRAARLILDDCADCVGLLDCYLVDAAGQRILHWPGYPEPAGNGRGSRCGEAIAASRIISRRMLDELGWQPYRLNGQPWPHESDHLSDDEQLTDNLRRAGGRSVTLTMAEAGCCYWNVKTGEELNGMSAFERAYGVDLTDVTPACTGFWGFWAGLRGESTDA